MGCAIGKTLLHASFASVIRFDERKVKLSDRSRTNRANFISKFSFILEASNYVCYAMHGLLNFEMLFNFLHIARSTYFQSLFADSNIHALFEIQPWRIRIELKT